MRMIVDWHRPCCPDCIVGKPVARMRNVVCRHTMAWSRLDDFETIKILGQVLRSRAEMAEVLRRWQRGEEIESDYIDPFATDV